MIDHTQSCLNYTEREELPQHLEVMTSQSEAGGAAGNEEPMENTVDVLLEFEIKEVHVFPLRQTETLIQPEHSHVF